MDILYPRCAGLDIHRDTIVACVRLAEAGGVVRFVETFVTTTSELERLSDWLSGHKVTHVAMEAGRRCDIAVERPPQNRTC
jgi:hypothetical protein